MSRENALFLTDIRQACERVLEFTKGLSRDDFFKDAKSHDAVLHNLQIIGEAVKHLSGEFKAEHPDIPWRKIAGFRDLIVHEYFGIDAHILWDIIRREVPLLRDQIRKL